LDEDRILEAENSLKQMLDVENLRDKSFLDIGSGSGLFSLAARRLGGKVRSFDYDPLCVACTEELKRRYFPGDSNWIIDQGDVLDVVYLSTLERYNIVYCWGVLHHTGNMWKALENVIPLVEQRGKLFISIYNDQGFLSQFWKSFKKFYNRSSHPTRVILTLCAGTVFQTSSMALRLFRGQNPLPFKYWAEKRRSRGMSVWHDLVDWVGGYPFEVAKPETIINFCRGKGVHSTKVRTCGARSGCNEYVFIRT